MPFQEEVIKQFKELLFARCSFIPVEKKERTRKKKALRILTTKRAHSQWVVTSAILKQYIKRAYYITLHLNFNWERKKKSAKVVSVFKFKLEKKLSDSAPSKASS